MIASHNGLNPLATSAASGVVPYRLRHCTTAIAQEERPAEANHSAKETVEARAGGVGAWPRLYHTASNTDGMPKTTCNCGTAALSGRSSSLCHAMYGFRLANRDPWGNSLPWPSIVAGDSPDNGFLRFSFWLHRPLPQEAHVITHLLAGMALSPEKACSLPANPG